MHYFYIATVFSGAFVYLLSALLLLLRRKSGERSRVILAVIILFSVFNYIDRFIDIINGNEPELVISPQLLLVANFMVFSYIIYPLEVISPNWINFKRILKLYSIWLLLFGVYLVSKWLGVDYTPHNSLLELLPYAWSFEGGFRLVLTLVLFSPLLFIYFIYSTKLYHNSDRVWIKKYVITFLLSTFAFILVLTFDNLIIHILYYYVSVGCGLYRVYLELFDRIIVKSSIAPTEGSNQNSSEKHFGAGVNTTLLNDRNGGDQRNTALIERLNNYMIKNRAWRNPDLSLNTLASELYTNRTTLAQALNEYGFENYTNYIKKLRIDDFLQQMESNQSINFQDAFFFAGFRSRTTALRNFQQVTGATPSEYFQKKNLPKQGI